MRLSPFLDGFAAAVRGAPPPGAAWLAPLLAQPGFAVYRNTGPLGLREALRANYPTVLQLVGQPCFDALADAFATASPPGDGRLMAYGEGFAAHLREQPALQDMPYLGAVAQLDRAWTECHLAADAPYLPHDALNALTALDGAGLAQARLRPHPAARWLWSPQHPAFTLWQRHRAGLAIDAPLDWHGEGALLARPDGALGAVRWWPLPHAGCVLLDHCAAGAPLGAAAGAALAADPAAPLPATVALLLRAGAFSTIPPEACRPCPCP